VLDRPDIFLSYFLTTVDRSAYTDWIGRPPSIAYDPLAKRIVVTATDAGNLYRPLVIDFDTY